MCVYLYVCVCVLGRQCEKGEREKRERERLGNPLFEHFVLCAPFVYWVPTLAGGLQLFSQTGISIARLVVRSVWRLCMRMCVSLFISMCVCVQFRWGESLANPHQLGQLNLNEISKVCLVFLESNQACSPLSLFLAASCNENPSHTHHAFTVWRVGTESVSTGWVLPTCYSGRYVLLGGWIACSCCAP